jgi:glycerol-3-phosphate acyltransferase PlsY
MAFNICMAALVGYLLGSVPFGLILVRVFLDRDIRQSGSGNIGATNVGRSSPGLGLLTLLLDAGKGVAAVLVAHKFWGGDGQFAIVAAVAALAAVVGHVFPIWLGFRGGKGVATGLGAFLILAPKAILLSVGIFVVVVLAFRQVSLGSIAAVLAFPLLAWALHDYSGGPFVLVLLGLAAIVIVGRHQANIRRLLAGTEPRFQPRRG